ncbi:transcriptional regulator TACO1-like protein [Jimgerdemannia flammicorona]|uniref:Transcriptional regulator TACO1-like protein n=1 Tax=Jimgerdemannia flammicorona TaxID=994334 RepID=A0A433QE58_9FUNG|nr:transcriptional regulator TACO1-like protein [Jimgerdemannia flammicorona]
MPLPTALIPPPPLDVLLNLTSLPTHSGSLTPVLWMFEKKGKLRFRPSLSSLRTTPDQLVEDAIEAGAEDVEEIEAEAEGEGEGEIRKPRTAVVEIICDYTQLATISRHLTNPPLNYEVTSLELAWMPTTTTEVKGETQEESLGRCIEMLEDLEDVVKVHVNAVSA